MICRPQWPTDCGVFEFTGHAFIVTDRDPTTFAAFGTGGIDGFGGASHPDVLRWIAGPYGVIDAHDAVLVAPGTASGDLAERHDLESHPRVERARRLRRDVRVYGDERGVVTLGRGVVDRWELSVELLDAPRGSGAGRALVRGGLSMVPADTFVFAQVAPGNAASLRTFLACGFVPIGGERLVQPSDRPRPTSQ